MIAMLKRGPADGVKMDVQSYPSVISWQVRVPIPADFIKAPACLLPVHLYRRVQETNIYFHERLQ